MSISFSQNVYYVAEDGDDSNKGTFKQPWKTIQYAVNKLDAGDTLNIKAGTYSEQITISNSGNPFNHIVIKNIEKNDIYNNTKDGVYMDANSMKKFGYNTIMENNIYNNGQNGIMFAGQHHCLVFKNVIHDNGWNFNLETEANALHGIYIMLADYNIIYDNKMYSNFNGGAVRLEGSYNLIRDNDFYNNGNGMYSTDCYGQSVYGCIIRNNRMHSNKQLYDGAIPGSGLEADGTRELRLYSNVFFDLEGFGLAYVAGHHHESSGAKVKNNIIMNTGWENIWIKEGCEEGYIENFNNIYPDKADAIKIGHIDYWLDDYKSATGQGENTISMDPLFIANNNFHLSPDSPCIDAGGFLTTTTSSDSGNRIQVKDVMYFCDGHGINQGDLIQLEGQTQTVRIANVNYENNIITIDGYLTWTKGQGVSLPYYGSAPDIGAYEYTLGTSIRDH